MPTSLDVNGARVTVEASGDAPLLYALRGDLALNGAKYGCGIGVCGCCAVLVDGVAVRSCVTPVGSLADAKITTLEGLTGADGGRHPLKAAFLAEQAGQCAYCVPGMIVTAAALLRNNATPSPDDIRQALDGNLCRCGVHNRVLRAVQRAAGEMAG